MAAYGPMSPPTSDRIDHNLAALRRRTALLQGLAGTRIVRVEDGPGASGRLVEIRTPSGLSLDVALDRGGDIVRVNWRGDEMGWHSAVGAPAPWPDLDAENGLGFLRGFDGFLVTCGLDHHGAPSETDASAFNYPLRQTNVHPLHGRIMIARASLLQNTIDWDAGTITVRTVVRQASVFGEVLELDRTLTVGLWEPRLRLADRVTNHGFQPTRHGLLYHVNIGYPLLDVASRLVGERWALRDRLDARGAVPTDDDVEIVDVGPSPAADPDGRSTIGILNPSLGVRLRLRFDAATLPKTALWQAFQSGVFALGLEPQTDLDAGSPLTGGKARAYGLEVSIDTG